MLVAARTPGHAFRQVVKFMIRQNIIKRQPASDSDGGWEHTSISVVK